MNQSGKIQALLATGRVANIPSVVSNVWLGWMVGLISSEAIAPQRALEPGFLLLPLAGVLLYLSGNFLNDWMDRHWDARHRPERALPRQVFAPRFYAASAAVLAALGLAAAFAASSASGWVALGIVFSILVYTVLHKRTAWAVIAMGLCRALLPVLGSVALFPYIDDIWPASAALLCHIMGLSLSARYESLAEPPVRAAILSRGLLLGTAVLVAWGNHRLLIPLWPSLMGALPYLLWTSLCLRIWRRPVQVLVSRLLAGIPLVDLMTLLPLSLTLLFFWDTSLNSWQITGFVAPVAAFFLASILQRVAPAT